MTHQFSRRAVVAALGAASLASCASVNDRSARAADIDKRVDRALDFLATEVPGAQDLLDKAVGVLIFPLITEAAFTVGGSYGEGALRINGVTVSYHSAAQASFGIQIGAQQYAQALFFMTPEALANFRANTKVSVGGNLKVTALDDGGAVNAATLTALDPIVALVFGQAGIIGGATVDGTVYSRLNL